MIAARDWLTVVLLPAYAPDLDPRRMGVGLCQAQPGQPRSMHLNRLEALIRNRLKSLEYRPGILDGLITGTSLALDPEPP